MDKQQTMKLTAKQKEVIQLMREKEGVLRYDTHFFAYKFNGRTLAEKTGNNLRALGIITPLPKKNGIFPPIVYTLTDLGRSIDLNAKS